MERKTKLITAKKLFGKNFIGYDELYTIRKEMGILVPSIDINQVPDIPYPEELLTKLSNDYILILGSQFYQDKSPLTIMKLREHFGIDPHISEPCFYNQDWYLNEKFANQKHLENKWYLIKKNVYEEGRGKSPQEIKNTHKILFPSAILACYTFFTYYFVNNGEILWKYDYIWCEDYDHNGDQIYVGRYEDPDGINKNGFSIHRHLAIRRGYSYIDIY